MKAKIIIITFIYVTVIINSLVCKDSEELKTIDNESLKSFLSVPVNAVIWTYKKIIGKGVRSFCPMYPSCSSYGLEVIKSKGLIIGSLAIVSRLDRCGHDTYIYPLIHKNKRILYYDPPAEDLKE